VKKDNDGENDVYVESQKERQGIKSDFYVHLAPLHQLK
jgi:hypothetical protein